MVKSIPPMMIWLSGALNRHIFRKFHVPSFKHLQPKSGSKLFQRNERSRIDKVSNNIRKELRLNRE